MKESIPFQEQSRQEKLGELLRTNKLAILLEIVLVLLPLYLSHYEKCLLTNAS